MSRAPMKPTSAGYPITFDIQEQTLDRLHRMALTDPARAAHRGDAMRTDRIRIADVIRNSVCTCGHPLIDHGALSGGCWSCGCRQYQSPTPYDTIARGDLGAIYQLLKDLEWSQFRAGCQLTPYWVPQRVRCCAECSGVRPDGFTVEAFPVEANGHTRDCRLLAAILTLRSALGAIE